jgi:hypothetical protein
MPRAIDLKLNLSFTDALQKPEMKPAVKSASQPRRKKQGSNQSRGAGIKTAFSPSRLE